MSFERLDFNTEPRKSEQEVFIPAFLQAQMRLPKSQWSKKFRRLIEEKIKENQQENVKDTEKSPAFLHEQTFKRYTEGLGLTESTLRGKKVLDLGSGEGEFVKTLIEKGITQEAYGIDVAWDETLIKGELGSHLRQGNFEEDIPVQDVDYVVSVGAVSNGIWGGEETMNIRRIIEKSIACLKEDGEIRIYPIQEAAKATPLKGLEKSKQKWNKLLAEISEAQKLECKIEPRDIRVTGNSNDIVLASVLVIRKKKDRP